MAIGAPPDYADLLGALSEGLELHYSSAVSDEAAEAIHLFVTERFVLEEGLPRLRKTLLPTGFIWVSWPKKASKVPTDVTEDVIREIALPLGLVDVKVCAVSEIWSGLKLMIRRSER